MNDSRPDFCHSNVQGSYDYPRYYEIAFNSNRRLECDFLEEAFRRHSRRRVSRIVDLACGTGQHLIRLAQRGYRMTGIDLSPENLAYIKARTSTLGLSIHLRRADIAAFRLAEPQDAAICMTDSQGHLLTNEAILSHLKCVAKSVRPGGLYIFDRMLPDDWVDPTQEYRWTRRQGATIVTTTFRTLLDVDPVSQVCWEELAFTVHRNGIVRRTRQRYQTRVVFPQELKAILQLCGVFDLVAWHPNFTFQRRLEDSKHPMMLVAILRRR
ncbi:MAG: class I SAM-dependent methyltransferase [Candidatus Rokubacteria bacterium]|nr:class I SAM-dependent methyltransferase [Candidatus Rokubacteria bacterium]